MALDDLTRKYNAYIRGWINYFSHFYKSALTWTLLRCRWRRESAAGRRTMN
jgi:hypothetical protein